MEKIDATEDELYEMGLKSLKEGQPYVAEGFFLEIKDSDFPIDEKVKEEMVNVALNYSASERIPFSDLPVLVANLRVADKYGKELGMSVEKQIESSIGKWVDNSIKYLDGDDKILEVLSGEHKKDVEKVVKQIKEDLEGTIHFLANPPRFGVNVYLDSDNSKDMIKKVYEKKGVYENIVEYDKK